MDDLSRDERVAMLAHEMSHAFAALLVGFREVACISRPGRSSLATSWEANLSEANEKQLAGIALSGLVTEMALLRKLELDAPRSEIIAATYRFEKDIQGFDQFGANYSDMVLFCAALSASDRDVRVAKYAVEVARISTVVVARFISRRKRLFDDIRTGVERLAHDGSMGLAFSPLNLLMPDGPFGMKKVFMADFWAPVDG